MHPTARPETPRYFATRASFRAWLSKNHSRRTELTVGFWKVSTGKGGLTWAEAVEEAIAFGWIDGVRRSHGASSYSNRFTPRRPGSSWSPTNIATARRLIRDGRMAPPGLAAFRRRPPASKTATAALQRSVPRFDPAHERRLERDPAASSWFSKQTPSYRRLATFWVVSAKLAETRERRFRLLLECSRNGKPVPPLAQTRRPKRPR